MRSILLLSNMYPGKRYPSHGIFVKNAELALVESGADINKIVIEDRHTGALRKLLKYVVFILNACSALLFTKRLVYIHYVAHSAIPVLLLSLVRRFTVVAHAHGGDIVSPEFESSWQRILKRFLARKTLKLSKAIIVPSEHFKQIVVRDFEIDEKKIFVSPSGGVDTQKFCVKAPTSAEQQLTFGYVGRLDSGKGLDTLLHALNKFEGDCHCIIVGGGNEAGRYQRLAEQLNLTDVVDFRGCVGHEELSELYQMFTWMVFPSELEESLGLVGLEAMACGKPVIGTMMGGMSEYMSEGENSLVFQARDSNSLLQALSQAQEMNSEQYEKLCKNARQTALLFDSKVVSQGLCQILERI